MKRLMKKIFLRICVLFLIMGLTKAYTVRASETNDGPDVFEYEGSTYEVISAKKHRVQLVKSRPLTDYDGKCYEQEAYVYRDDVKYSVYSIGYKAFSEDGLKCKVEVKLPSTVRELKTESIGVNIVKLDLSGTKVKTIPSFLFVTYNGTKDVTPAVKEVLLPASCKKIESYALYKCSNIKSLVLPNKVKKIGYNVVGKTCTKITIEGKVPGGILNQNMKETILYVKDEYYIDTLEMLIKQVSLGKCRIEKLEE